MSAIRSEWVFAGGLALLALIYTLAQNDATPDVANGMLVAADGGHGGPPTACAGCHGMDGAGAEKHPEVPRITGQPAYYIFKQLNDYATLTRPHDVMSSITRGLSDKEMRDVSGYYASLDPAEAPPRGLPPGDPQRIGLGATLAEQGDEARGLGPCKSCHGPAGAGMAPMFPALAGQHPNYLATEMRKWRDGSRNNDPLGVMSTVVGRLKAEEIEALAAYFASLRQPARPEAATKEAAARGR